VDYAWNFTYSNTKAILIKPIAGSSAWLSFPNPSQKSQTLVFEFRDWSRYHDELIYILISDPMGNSTTRTVYGPSEVAPIVNSYLTNSGSGIFLVSLFWGNSSEQFKLIRR